MNEITELIEIYCNDKIAALETDKRKITIWCTESAECLHKIKEYQNVINWLHNKRGCVEIRDVVDFLSSNVTNFDNELRHSLLTKARWRLLTQQKVYTDLLQKMWNEYPNEMHDIYW